MTDKRKVALALALGICIALLFWSQSRLPQLNEKAQMAERTTISAIAFDVIYPVSPEEAFHVRAAKTAGNWAFSNWKGMTFGLLFAAAVLTLLSVLPPWKTSRYAFVNALKGLFAGVPLSVCVNCTTPIAYAMHQAGLNLVTVLSTLMSSPTLNVIVLTMAFSLLPLHLALIKLVSTLILILVLLPLLVRRLQQWGGIDPSSMNSLNTLNAIRPGFSAPGGIDDASCALPELSTNWTGAARGILIDYCKYLLFILRMTVPLMLFAGLLGALLIEAVGFTELQSLPVSFWSLLAVALVGAILPVPIAFDVIVVVTLISLGMPTGLAMTLLFSLGIYSIYPALIIARNISLTLSLSLFAITVLAAILVGATSQAIDTHIRVAEATKLSLELKHSQSLEALSIVIAECRELGTMDMQGRCLEVFLGGEYAMAIDPSACERIEGLDQTLLAICQNTIDYNNTLRQAVAQQNIDQCLQLENPDQQGRCWMQFAVQRALDPQAISWCDTFTKEHIKQECRTSLLFYRVARMQNSEACNVPVTAMERQDCLSHLTTMQQSLGGDVASCSRLAKRTQVQSCLRNMFLMVINDEHRHEFCDELTDPGLRAQCANYAHFDRARSSGEITHCSAIGETELQQRCQIAAAHKKSEVRILGNALMSAQQLTTHMAREEKSVPISKIDDVSREVPVSNSESMSPWQDFIHRGPLSIVYTEHADRTAATGTFRKWSGRRLGVEGASSFRISDFFEPFSYGRGIASGDFNNDYWPDLAFATNDGVALFRNKGDGTFEKQRLFAEGQQPLGALVTAFVDINNDGWQDLFISTYGGINYFFINRLGQFTWAERRVERQDHRIATMAAGFADWDKDGDLDYVAGNWSYGTHGAFNPQYSHNHWLINKGSEFETIFPDELEGDTLSVLLSDLDLDQNIDLAIANDREYPDHYYWGNSEGRLIATKAKDSIPVTSLNNMSIETADFNNDLLLDLFSTDMTFAVGESSPYCSFLLEKHEQERCGELLRGYKFVQNVDVAGCASFEDRTDQQDCLVALAIQMANRGHDDSFCNEIPPTYDAQKMLCNTLATRGTTKVKIMDGNYIQQKQNNILLMRQADGRLIDRAEEFNVSGSYWSWNARAADIDNDEWQDIYAGNGYEFGTKNNEIHSNVFFHNQQGQRFTQAEEEFGLDDQTNTSSYTYLDLDRDGDIDIVAASSLSEPRIFLNETNTRYSISFSLRDYLGNRFCINCKVIIHYGAEKHQLREIKLSGGFQSFDNPVVHFGLGAHEEISRLEIFWSTGEPTSIGGPLPANRHYLISRGSEASPPKSDTL